jgi:NAD(P)-dependent dehydrogenase (short-subunit alcohol dehydrogenase family)
VSKERQDEHPVVLITGALTGIGRASAVAFAKGGSRVVISGRHEETGQTLATELRALGAEAKFVLLTWATKTMCGSWSIKRALASAGSTQPSITPAPKATLARSPSSQLIATQPPSIPMCSAPCSA